MEAKMVDLKKASHCWWFDSHNSAKRSPWLKSTLSELEKKTKGMLNVTEGDADSFAQRAEMYYKKRPQLVSMIEDLYRSYRYLAEQHDLLRSEAGTRRLKLCHSDSSHQNCSQKTWDSTDTFNYPDSEVSEIDDPEPEEAAQVEAKLMMAEEKIEGNGRNIEAKLTITFNSTAAAGATVENKINLTQVPAKIYKSNRTSYSFGDRQMETNDLELEHQNEGLEICSRNTMKLTKSPLDCSNSNHERIETIAQCEIVYSNIDYHETKVLYEKSVDVLKLKSQVEKLKVENETLKAELEKKDEEKRHVIRQLSLTVEILKEDNVNLKGFIKDSKKCGSIFEFKKLKDAFSGTGKLFGLTSQFQPSLVAL